MKTEMTTYDHFDQFLQAYLQAALWSSTIEAPDPHAGASFDRHFRTDQFTERSLEILTAHARSFWSRMWYYIDHEDGDASVARAGHDFWLTSQGHGSGFWDGDWVKYGDLLTKLSKCYPSELQLNVTPDGLEVEID